MNEQECRRILEVANDASMEEITQAYHQMKKFYENENAVFFAPSMEEFAPETRLAVLDEIEIAYRQLSAIHTETTPPVVIKPVDFPDENRPVDGRMLREVRTASGASLEYISSETHVRLEYLSALEEDRFWDLPPAAVNVRGFLSAYAAAIGLPVERVVPSYMERFQKWQARRGKNF